MARHTAGLRLAALLLVGTLAGSAPSGSLAPPAPPTEPRITFLDQPTPEQLDILTWAASRFGDAGLQLPDLEVSFPALCAGKAALYHVGRASLEFCRISRRVALHELAHAWDDTSGAVDRAAFLELRHLSVWFGGIGLPSSEQGSEHLADIIAWGLLDVETRGVPQLPANSESELTAAFIMLTGDRPGQGTGCTSDPIL